ncbi:hypothetical protein GS432_08085 [Rhodococcus hoagii]|nr:hypothetical protein [Prescottella equi]MBM4577224.1 hypothetical protein [Prescottella equi]NKV09775.1 hypothetical protein [Prescottella equi]
MTSNEIATQSGGDLATTSGGDLVGTNADRGAYSGGYTEYSPAQRDQLRALGGLDEASDGDIAMLKAVSDRSGLDPFVKQIYLVGRKTKTGGYRGEPERWETKWSVQVGIDGFRAVTHRYAEEKGLTVELGRPVFYDAEGNQQLIWLRAWGYPAAAEVTVRVGQSTATAVATWDEYVQTKRDGSPNSMWDKMPTVMLAKCAEAQAHRRVCPLTAGMHEPAELAHLDSEPVRVVSERVPAGPKRGMAGLADSLGVGAASDSSAEPEPAQVSNSDQGVNVDSPADSAPTADPLCTRAQQQKLAILLDNEKVGDRQAKLDYLEGQFGRKFANSKELTKVEASRLIEFLEEAQAADAAKAEQPQEAPVEGGDA